MDIGTRPAPATHQDGPAWLRRGAQALQQRRLDEADDCFARAAALDPSQPAPPLGRAMVLAARGRLREAADAVRALLAAHPAFAPGQRALADWLREIDPAEAGLWFTRCARAEPSDVGAIGGALLLAARLAGGGIDAPPAPPPRLAPAAALTSVVACSIDARKLARARASLARAFGDAPWELVAIGDAKSLCEGWNRGLAAARGDTVVFCHDDIVLECGRLGQRIAGALADDDVVGVAGSTRLAGPNWAWAGAPHAHGWVTHVRGGEVLAGAYALDGPRIGGIESLDGVFLAMRRETAVAVGFDAETFDGFHLYDTDFCWRARRAGLRLGVRCDLGLVHWSEGGFDAVWARFACRFLARAGLPELPMAPVPGAGVPVPSPAVLPRLHGWLAHWVAAA
jgi:tetratricopeptide (TPR) repeat protein